MCTCICTCPCCVSDKSTCFVCFVFAVVFSCCRDFKLLPPPAPPPLPPRNHWLPRSPHGNKTSITTTDGSDNCVANIRQMLFFFFFFLFFFFYSPSPMLVRITCSIVKSRSSRETFTVYFDVPILTWIICLRFSGTYIRIINFKLCFCSFYLSALKYSCISLVHFNPCAILPPFRVDHHVWQRYSKLSYKRRGRM